MDDKTLNTLRKILDDQMKRAVYYVSEFDGDGNPIDKLDLSTGRLLLKDHPLRRYANLSATIPPNFPVEFMDAVWVELNRTRMDYVVISLVNV